jgi:hypothetical protein
MRGGRLVLSSSKALEKKRGEENRVLDMISGNATSRLSMSRNTAFRRYADAPSRALMYAADTKAAGGTHQTC